MQGQFGDMLLKMNFRGIFLAKCLVVLFSCVKGSTNEAHKVYGVLGGSVFLDIHDFQVEKQHELKWLKLTSLLVKGKDSDVKYYKNDKYRMFPNGTLQIDSLVEEDSGSYTVNVYNDVGQQQVEKNLILSVQEIVSKPEIKWTCLQKLINVTCEVKQKHQPDLRLLQNNKQLSVRSTDANGIWKTEYQLSRKILTSKIQCEVKNDVSKKTADQEIKCPASTANKSICHGGLEEISNTDVISQESPKNTSLVSSYAGPLDIVLIGSIAGGAVVFVIFLALLIYCIRKKRAERYEEQDEETPMKNRQASDELKYRELPQPPVPAPQKQPRQQQRPPPRSQTQYQAGPPRPRPRTQQKSPSHMKERL